MAKAEIPKREPKKKAAKSLKEKRVEKAVKKDAKKSKVWYTVNKKPFGEMSKGFLFLMDSLHYDRRKVFKIQELRIKN